MRARSAAVSCGRSQSWARITRRDMREDFGRPHRLVEAERDDRRLIEPAVHAIPLRLHQLHGRPVVNVNV